MQFEEIWTFIVQHPGPTVQERAELEYVFNLIRGCQSYLEVGTAEGKSLYALSHALAPQSEITYIDLGEEHTTAYRNSILESVKSLHKITPIHGDSSDLSVYQQVKDKRFDVVLIDAGHTLFNVLIDACWYGPLATKYLIFHDITIPDVNRVFEWCCQNHKGRSSRVINSETFGYGIIEI